MPARFIMIKSARAYCSSNIRPRTVDLMPVDAAEDHLSGVDAEDVTITPDPPKAHRRRSVRPAS